MSSEQNDSDKEHQATGKRLADLRKKGSVLRSKDLSGGLTLLIAVMQIMYLSSEFQTRVQKNLAISTEGIKNILVNHDAISIPIKEMVLNSISFLLPIFLVSFVAAFLSPFLFGGWNFTLEALHFKFDNLNPLNNLKSIFSPKRAVTEIFKSIMKSSVIIGALIYYVFTEKNEILALTTNSTTTAIKLGCNIISHFITLLCFSVILLVIMDMAIQFFQYKNKSKMSTQELKDENKDLEGNVDVKRKIRSKQIALMKQRLHSSVSQATVVITNPTHYAVALRYDENKDHAPRLLAKGKGMIAQQIRHLAISHAIAIYEAPVLARAIYHTTRTGLEIKPELYMAVAIVLSYVHQLKNYQLGKGQLPNIVNDLQIPNEFIYSE